MSDDLKIIARINTLLVALNVAIIGFINIFGLAEMTLQIYCIVIVTLIPRFISRTIRRMKERRAFDKAAGLGQKALLLCYDNRPQQALEVINMALDICPKFAQGWVIIGFAHEAMGDEQGAIAAYMEAIAIDPTSSSAHMGLSRIFSNMGLFRLAEGELDYAGCEQTECLN